MKNLEVKWEEAVHKSRKVSVHGWAEVWWDGEEAGEEEEHKTHYSSLDVHSPLCCELTTGNHGFIIVACHI